MGWFLRNWRLSRYGESKQRLVETASERTVRVSVAVERIRLYLGYWGIAPRQFPMGSRTKRDNCHTRESSYSLLDMGLWRIRRRYCCSRVQHPHIRSTPTAERGITRRCTGPRPRYNYSYSN